MPTALREADPDAFTEVPVLPVTYVPKDIVKRNIEKRKFKDKEQILNLVADSSPSPTGGSAMLRAVHVPKEERTCGASCSASFAANYLCPKGKGISRKKGILAVQAAV